QTLTTISKRVVRLLREGRTASAAAPSAPAAPPRHAPAPRPAARAPEPPRPAPLPRRPAPPAPRLTDLEEAALAAGDEFDERDEAVHRAAGLLDASWPDVAASYALESDDELGGPRSAAPARAGRFGLEITAPHGAAGDWR